MNGNRLNRQIFLLLLMIIVLVLIAGCSQEETMNNTDEALKTGKPPIDLEGVLKTETATFALG